MGRLSKSVFRHIDNIPETARKVKYTIGEDIAIIKKKKLYNKVKWTPEEQNEFHTFWKRFGGMRPYWHKLYQSINGTFDVRYFPEKLYTTKLEPMVNPWIYTKIFSDKNMIETLWSDVSEVYIPRTYLKCINNSLYDCNGRSITRVKAKDALNNIGKCIKKPTVDSSSGNNIRLLNIIDGIDVLSGEPLETVLSDIENNSNIQELIHNNKALKALNQTSLNTIRVITFRVEDQIHVAPLTLRIGVGDSSVDNIHSGGLCIGINEDGTLKEYAYKLGWGDNNLRFSEHPTSKLIFKDYYIGDIQKLLQAAKKLHEKVLQLGIVSWDLTFNDRNDVTIIEANCSGQSVWFPQVINCESLFGKDTEYFLDLIKKSR